MAERGWRRNPTVILGALTTLNGLNYLDRYVVAATLTLILEDFKLSDSQGGLLQSMFIVTYALACPVAGWLGDRGNRMWLAAAGIFVWSLATVGSGLAPTYAMLLLARAMTGVGEAGYGVVTPALLSDCYPPPRRPAVLGIFYAAIPVGSALGYVVGGVIGQAHGWRQAFFVAGAPGIALALLLLLLVEPRRGTLDATPAPAPTAVSSRGVIRLLWSRKSYGVNTTAQIIYTFAMGGLATWAPAYFVRERGIPLAVAASTFGLLLVVAGFLGTLIGGSLAQRLARRWPDAAFRLSGWSLTLSIVFTLFAILSPHPVIFWPAMFVMLLLLFINVGPLNAALANVLPAALRARGFALTTMLMHLLGDAISPWLIGNASDQFGLKIPVLVTGCLLSVSGLVLLIGRRTLEHDLLAMQGAPGAAPLGIGGPETQNPRGPAGA
jgi:MFS family permease